MKYCRIKFFFFTANNVPRMAAVELQMTIHLSVVSLHVVSKYLYLLLYSAPNCL